MAQPHHCLSSSSFFCEIILLSMEMMDWEESGSENWLPLPLPLPLPTGFRFKPTDKELICYYLFNKVCGRPLHLPPDFLIPELDVYEKAPWQFNIIRSRYLLYEDDFYCFVRMKRSTARDNRLKRKACDGSWIANSKLHTVTQDGRAVAGTWMSLKFFKDSHDPTKNKKDKSLATKWVMHEYRLHAALYKTIAPCESEEIVLCRIHQKGTRSMDDEDDEGYCKEAPPSAAAPEGGRSQQDHNTVEAPQATRAWYYDAAEDNVVPHCMINATPNVVIGDMEEAPIQAWAEGAEQVADGGAWKPVVSQFYADGTGANINTCAADWTDVEEDQLLTVEDINALAAFLDDQQPIQQPPHDHLPNLII